MNAPAQAGLPPLSLKDPKLFRVKIEEEAVRVANASEFGLEACFFSRDVGRVFRAPEAL